MNKQYVKRVMYLGGGTGNAQFSTELVGWNIPCKIRIFTQDIKFVGENNMDINYFKQARIIYDQIEELEIQLAGINEQIKYRRRADKGKSISNKPNWILRLEGVSDVDIDCDDELVQIICSYLSEKRDKLKERFLEI